MITRAIRVELVQGLCSIFGNNLREIILYGSVARNEDTD